MTPICPHPQQLHKAAAVRQHCVTLAWRAVRFSARELWGEQAAPRDTVYVDMWDDYLERA